MPAKRPASPARADVSFWQQQLPDRAPRPPLGKTREADVCIVGGGYTGLWTAYELCRADPSLAVVVLEAETVGFGASGRNGGWVVGELAGDRERWAASHGRDAVIALGAAIAGTVDEVGRVVAAEGIACDWAKGGSLQVAQSELELRRLAAYVGEARAWGLGEADVRLLDASATAARVNVAGAIGGAYTPHCARVQPARLAAGLADAAERHGAVIHEHSRVTAIVPGAVLTAGGAVRARQIVRATEAYTADLPGLHRLLVPLTSSMIVTEPLDAAVWDELGWDGMDTLADGRRRYIYAQRTADGRIAIGGRGIAYRLGSDTAREGPLPQRVVEELRERLEQLFPAVRGARMDGAWHGVLGVPRDWSPAVGLDRATGLAWAGGYVGEGVAAANLAGRTLRDLLLGRDTELTRLPWVGPFARPWEPEPLRFLGVRSVWSLYGKADAREPRTGRVSVAGRVADALAGR